MKTSTAAHPNPLLPGGLQCHTDWAAKPAGILGVLLLILTENVHWGHHLVGEGYFMFVLKFIIL